MYRHVHMGGGKDILQIIHNFNSKCILFFFYFLYYKTAVDTKYYIRISVCSADFFANIFTHGYMYVVYFVVKVYVRNY